MLSNEADMILLNSVNMALYKDKFNDYERFLYIDKYIDYSLSLHVRDKFNSKPSTSEIELKENSDKYKLTFVIPCFNTF